MLSHQGVAVAIHPFWAFGFLFVLAIPVLIALLVIWAVKTQPVSVPPAVTPPAETPLDILARRFASGEITAEEYQKARDLLRGDKPPPS
jgi:uncharacterized membrane protein